MFIRVIPMHTFIVCADYRRNMTLLDKRRLGKQRLEARDICERVIALRRIYKWYCEHPPIEDGETQDWRKLYPYIPILPNENELPYDQQALLFTRRAVWAATIAKVYLALATQLIIVGEKLVSKPKTYKCNGEAGEKPLFTKRHAHHPMVGMWMGYEESIKLYYNTCIKEWIARGCNNTMQLYDLQVDESAIIHPWWVSSSYLQNSHKGALLRKELVRGEKDWYWVKPEIVKIRESAYYPLGYCWPTKLTARTIEMMMTRKNVPPGLVCAPILKDFVAQTPYLTDDEGYVIVEYYA